MVITIILILSIILNIFFCFYIIKTKKLYKLSNIILLYKKLIQIIKGKEGFDDIPQLVKYKAKGKIKAIHISSFTMGNIGDAVLSINLRDLFNTTIGIKYWEGLHVHKLITDEEITTINNNNLLIIGGGGLFLKDTNPNNNSGWQWNCSIEMLNKIKTPIIAFAIGYNRFRGQDDFEPVFTKHINEFVKKAKFIGLRNNGSINALRSYITDPMLKNKIVFQPCMTTLISKIYPKLTNYNQKEDYIGLNCAFDRSNLRTLNDNKLKKIAYVIKELSQKINIKVFIHVSNDQKILEYLNEINVPYQSVTFKDINSVIQYYSKAKLVIGMRGHSQMIPFGCNTPILSIITHDKMKWFLDDINHPEWGIEIDDDNFEDTLLIKAKNIISNYEEIIKQIIISKEKLWEITKENCKLIQKEI